MDIIDYYTELSKKEIMSVKEVKLFDEQLNDEFSKVSNLKFNRSFFKKLTHPIVTIRSNFAYKKLNKIKTNFNYFMNSDVLQYVKEETGELATDLDYAARYYKPKAAVEYVRTLKKDNKKVFKNNLCE